MIDNILICEDCKYFTSLPACIDEERGICYDPRRCYADHPISHNQQCEYQKDRMKCDCLEYQRIDTTVLPICLCNDNRYCHYKKDVENIVLCSQEE